jgi:hypothetical protein
LIEVISSAPDDQHELLLSVKVQEGDSCRFLITHHVAMNGDDGSSSVPVQYEMMGRDAFVRAIADSDVGRRFPEGGFLIGPDEATQIEAVGGDEWLFSDGVSRAQPFLWTGCGAGHGDFSVACPQRTHSLSVTARVGTVFRRRMGHT